MSVIWLCVVVAGCATRDLLSPRFANSVKISSFSTAFAVLSLSAGAAYSRMPISASRATASMPYLSAQAAAICLVSLIRFSARAFQK